MALVDGALLFDTFEEYLQSCGCTCDTFSYGDLLYVIGRTNGYVTNEDVDIQGHGLVQMNKQPLSEKEYFVMLAEALNKL